MIEMSMLFWHNTLFLKWKWYNGNKDKEVLKMKTSERIRELRKARDVTQQELADAIKMNQSVVNRIERGTRPIRDDELKELARFFNVSTDYLLGNYGQISTYDDKERQLVNLYRVLNDADKQHIFYMLDRLAAPKLAHA